MTESVIRLKGVTKTYDLGEVKVEALRGIDLEVTRGDLLAIMGASGSGKSTLLNILGCLDKPTTGSYHLMDEDVSQKDKTALAHVRSRMIGFIFQGFNLLPRTSALANVELPLIYSNIPAKERHQRATEALGLVNLADRKDHHPSQLSGGQQQRVAIARSIINQPAILLADEPTGNLDTATSVEIMNLLLELNRKGLTVVLITHEPDIATYARKRIVLRDGLIVTREGI